MTLQRLINSIIGTSPSDCEIIDLIHYGNPSVGFQRGLSDVVAGQGSYMLELVSYAMIVESAYQALTNMDNIELTYMSVSSQYSN